MNIETFEKLFPTFARVGKNRNNEYDEYSSKTEIYCNTCYDTRRVDVKIHKYDPSYLVITSLYCRQCESEHLATWACDRISKKKSFTLLPLGNVCGIHTKNSPPIIIYWLNQACLSEIAGANSAALAMYRVALEQLLCEEGYKKGLLNAKITDLCNDIKNNKAPKWAQNINDEYLHVMRNIGNGASHAKIDLQQQNLLDEQLVKDIKAVFSGLLYHIYEQKHQSQLHLNELKRRAALLSKK